MFNISHNDTQLWFYLLTFFTCIGCSSYQYVAVRSDLSNQQTQQNIYDTDSIRVTYSFIGKNGPVQIEVFNKQSQPLYVDWEKSALIVKDQTLPYWRDESVLHATTTSDSYNLTPTFTDTKHLSQGIISRMAPINFIPPQSFISHSTGKVKQELFTRAELTLGSAHEAKVNRSKVVRYAFERSNSPLTFRSYLTLSYKKDFSKTTVLDHSFWVNEIHSSNRINYEFETKPNQFYLKGFNMRHPSAIAIILGSFGMYLIVGLIASQ